MPPTPGSSTRSRASTTPASRCTPTTSAGFVDDPFVIFPVSFGFIVGGLGFPVYVEIIDRWRHDRADRRGMASGLAERAKPWSLHARVTVGVTLVLLVVGPLMVLGFEWTNPDTLGSLGLGDKLSNAWFQGVTSRTAGFNTIDFGAMNETTLLGTSVLMFVGAGPASTSGGIKVTTVAVLTAVLWAEVRGEQDVNIFRRRLPTPMVRQALTIVMLSILFVGVTCRGADGERRVEPDERALRVDLGVRDRRAVDRCDGLDQHARSRRADRRHDLRPCRSADLRDRDCASRERSPLSSSRGATDHWLRNVVQKMLRGLGPTVEHRGEIIVIGLGRFGSALSRTLIEMGHEVLGLDLDPQNVQEHTGLLTHVAEVDTTSLRALRQLGVADATTVIVCIGNDVEASVLTTAALADLGVPNIWAKAMTEPHGRILGRVGAHNVVFPEAEMGARVAHLVTGRLLEYLALDEDFVLVEVVAPESLVGVPLGETNLRRDHRVTIVCHKPPGGGFSHADRETVLTPNELIVVAGTREHVEAFATEVG